MPIYEYQAIDPQKGCSKCRDRFEVLQKVNDLPLNRCPSCGGKIRKIISWCRAAIVESSEESLKVERKIQEYEREEMWSHAAELADKHAEKTKDASLRMRALDNYKKAGYDVDRLSRYADFEDK